MKIDRERAEKAFNSYVEKYNSNDGKVKLKIFHTYRVSKICEEISSNLGFTKEDIDISYLTGLLHDIGRFEQIRRYGTFNDSKSCNHAELGVEVLFKEGRIRDFIDDDSCDDLIETVIRCHNLYEIPDDLSDRTKGFVKILRDADKIDIFRVDVTEPIIDVYGYSKDELYNSLISKEVMETFIKKQTIVRDTRKTAIDNHISFIAFVFGIYYDESIKIALKQGYLDKLINFKSNNEITNREFVKVREVVKEYLCERGL